MCVLKVGYVFNWWAKAFWNRNHLGINVKVIFALSKSGFTSSTLNLCQVNILRHHFWVKFLIFKPNNSFLSNSLQFKVKCYDYKATYISLLNHLSTASLILWRWSYFFLERSHYHTISRKWFPIHTANNYIRPPLYYCYSITIYWGSTDSEL